MGCVNSKKPVQKNVQPLNQSKITNANNIPGATDRLNANNENVKSQYDPKYVPSLPQPNREPLKQSQQQTFNFKETNSNIREAQGSKINQIAASKISNNNPISNSKISDQVRNPYEQQFPADLNQQSKISKGSNARQNVDYDQLNSKSLDRQQPMNNSRNSNPNGANMDNFSMDAVREQGNCDFNLGVSKFDIKVSVTE